MIGFVLYDVEGRVYQIGNLASLEDFKLQRTFAEAQGAGFLAVSDHRAEVAGLYVDPAAQHDPETVIQLSDLARPALPVAVSKTIIRADDSDSAVISGIPPGLTIYVDGQPHVVDDGELTITSPMAATYVLVCRQWPYQDWSVAIEAVS